MSLPKSNIPAYYPSLEGKGSPEVAMAIRYAYDLIHDLRARKDSPSSLLTSTPATDALDKPRCRAYLSGSLSISNGVETIVTLDTEEFDIGAMHSNTIYNSRLRAPSAGPYIICGSIGYAVSGTGFRSIRIAKNGGFLLPLTKLATGNAAAQASTVAIASASVIAELVAGDFIEIAGYQDSGGSLVISPSKNHTFLAMARL